MAGRYNYAVIAVVVISLIIVGAVGYWLIMQGSIRYLYETEPMEYDFEQTSATPPTSITLNVDISAGEVNVTFVDNSTLIYRIHVTTIRRSVDLYGPPTVTYSSNTIVLNYPDAAADIELGNGANYTINTKVDAGSTKVIAGAHANLGNVHLNSSAGAIEFTLANTATVNGNTTVDLETNVGSIEVNVALPSSVSGSYTSAATIGGNTINAQSPWTEVSSTQYETADYGLTTNSITIDASADVGAIIANLS